MAGYSCEYQLSVMAGYSCEYQLSVMAGYSCEYQLSVTAGYSCEYQLSVMAGYSCEYQLSVMAGYSCEYQLLTIILDWKQKQTSPWNKVWVLTRSWCSMLSHRWLKDKISNSATSTIVKTSCNFCIALPLSSSLVPRFAVSAAFPHWMRQYFRHWGVILLRFQKQMLYRRSEQLN